MWTPIDLKSVRGNVSIVPAKKGHLERTHLPSIQVGAVDKGEITPKDDARSVVHSTHWADIFHPGTVVIPYLADDLIPSKIGAVGTAIVKDHKVGQ